MPAEYRFSFGPWNIHVGADPFGPPVRATLEAAAKRPNAIRRYASLVNRMTGLPKNIIIEPSRITISPDAIAFFGKANSFEAATAFSKHIDGADDLSSEIGSITPQDDGARFNIKITYKDREKR